MPTLLAIARFLLLLIPVTATAGICQPSTPGYFHKYLSGKIDGKYAFKMELICRDGVVRGNYRYASKNVPINLSGRVGPDGALALEETAGYGIPGTGTFGGVLGSSGFDGMWTSADGKRKLPFAAGQTSEMHIGTRRQIVSAAVGDYALANISGNGGANAMWDTGKTKNGWESGVSSNSGGMRQGNRIKLTPADKRLLDSLTIRVRPDLTTELIARGSVILAIPFSESGAQFNVTSAENAPVSDSFEKLWAEANLQDETLYVLAQDGVDFSRAISGNFEGVVGDVVLVRYAIVDDRFDVEFRTGQCCNNSVFSFRRQPPARQK